MSDEPTERDVEACPIKWCGFPMPHEHTQGSATTWTDLLNDPAQQLDQRGEVLARVRVASLTTAQKEWLDHAALYGNLHEVVETLLAQARREGAAEVEARVMEVLRPGCFGGFAPDVDPYDVAAALRGDA